MAWFSCVERRRQPCGFRVRMPVWIARAMRHEPHRCIDSQAEPGVSKVRAAKLYFVVAAHLETMSLKMIDGHHIKDEGQSQAERLATEAFRLGPAYERGKDQLRQEFLTALNQLIASCRLDDIAADLPAGGMRPHRVVAAAATEREGRTTQDGLSGPSGPALSSSDADCWRDDPRMAPTLSTSPPWHSLLEGFFEDKPGIATKTRWSYDQAFSLWRALIGDKPIATIRRTDLKTFADHLRDRPNARGGRLNRKTIGRSLGHIKTFMAWAVAAGFTEDDNFGGVQARSATSEERIAGPPRRAFTDNELLKLFRCPIFLYPRNRSDQADAMFLVVAALTGARTEELATAPAALVRLGDVNCLDLRSVGRKTGAAPRLVPILPDLARIGLLNWSSEQEARGYLLLQPDATPRTAAGWSKRLNRYISKHISDDPELVLYSLRHSFGQMLRAAALGDELADKVLGHSSGKVGSGYGRDLSAQEAALFVERVRPPLDLGQLWQS